MGYTARRRLFVSATAVFAALMLAALAVIARDGVSGAINRAIFGVLVMPWSVTLTGFPFALIAILYGTPKAAPRGPGRPASLPPRMVEQAVMATLAALVWTSLVLELGAAIVLVGVAAKLARGYRSHCASTRVEGSVRPVPRHFGSAAGLVGSARLVYRPPPTFGLFVVGVEPRVVCVGSRRISVGSPWKLGVSSGSGAIFDPLWAITNSAQFLNMNIGDAAFDPTTFSKNRDRLPENEVAHRFFEAVRGEAERRRLLSDEHFTLDGTLLEAWASVKSVRPKDDDDRTPPQGRNVAVDFHGDRRRNETHASTTDPEALLAKKSYGTAAKPNYAGHLLMENGNGLVVGAALTAATGFAERETGLRLLHERRRERPTEARWTVAADKGYDTKDFVAGCRALKVTPHVTQNTSNRRSAIDARTTRHPGYAVSQRLRKRVEEIFGWTKTVGGGRKLRYIGQKRNEMWMLLTVATYNVVRMANLELAAA
jgi:Transposase DDE domain